MFNFEMHRGLMDDMDEDIPAFCAYYENPWLRARQDGNEPLRFLFSPADEYLYFLAHAYKHFSRAGCGVRFIADEWVLLGHYGDELSGSYLEGELEKLGLAKFDRLVRDMAQAVFGGEGEAPRLTDDQQRLWRRVSLRGRRGPNTSAAASFPAIRGAAATTRCCAAGSGCTRASSSSASCAAWWCTRAASSASCASSCGGRGRALASA